MKKLFLLIALLASNVGHAALQKEKALASGVSGNYWAVSDMRFNRASMTADLVWSLYKDNTPGLAPLGKHHQMKFKITPQEMTGNVIAWAHTKTLAYADSDLPNLNGEGTHKGCPDLIGAAVVP